MSNESAAEQAKRLMTLEKRVKMLEQALMAEQKKTAGMQQTLSAYEGGLGQVLDTYDKAFDKAAQSYEPIIQRALTLSGRKADEKAKPQPVIVDKKGVVQKDDEGKEPAFLDNVVAIVDDLPKLLAAMALIISLFTGGTSIVSLVQSNFAHSQASEAKTESGAAKLDATEAKKDAETAKEGAVMAVDTANVAQSDAVAAKKDAEIAKEGAVVAVETANTAQIDAAAAQKDAELAVVTADKALEQTVNQPGP